MPSRSTKELRDDPNQLPLGSGLLDRAKRAMKGRKKKLDEAIDGPSEKPKTKTKGY